MSAVPVPAQPNSTQQALDQEHIRQGVHELIDLGLGFARMLYSQAEALTQAAPVQPSPHLPTPNLPTPNLPTPNLPALAAAFDQTARAVRRAMLLARKLAEPLTAAPPRHLARRQIIREVEDAIHCNAADEGTDPRPIHAEFLDRLDSPDLDDELGNRSLEAIITDICRDLGVYGGIGDFKRRTPEDVQKLHDRAAQPAAPRGTPPRPNRPRPVAGSRSNRKLPDDDAEAVAMLLGNYAPRPKPDPRPP